jgi:transposase
LKQPDRIRAIVSDLWRPYREAVQLVLPDATLVADKFHVLKLATSALEKLRKEISAGLTETKRKTLKMHDRYLLLRRKHDLKPEELFVLESWIKNIPLLGQGYELKERFFAIYDQPNREAALDAYFAWMESIPAELYPTYTPLMLTIEEWGDEIFAHFDQNRVTGAFIEGANGLARVLSRMGRGYGLKALRGRLLYGLCEGRDRKRVPANKSENGNGVDGPFLGAPLSRILPQEPLVKEDAPSTLES